jgi:RimJ/RimL family protein N-acetyltransferase
VAFETDRLLVRRWTADDLGKLLLVYGDADTMRWVGDGQPMSEAQGLQWLKVTANNYRTRGYGMFAVMLRGSRSVIGFCGLVHPGGQAEAEIKYAFAKEHWGMGFATEVVVALLAFAAGTHRLREVIATVAPENLASQRVLAKAGMLQGTTRTEEDGSLTAVYSWRPRSTDEA